MIRRIPAVASVIVLMAVGVMLWLGFWQIDRMHQKEALLARYAAAQADTALVNFPRDTASAEASLYHHSRIECLRVTGMSGKSGRNAAAEPGYAHSALCDEAGGGKAQVVLGWSNSPESPLWTGGAVSGTIAPGPRLVADPPLAGLQANARPDPADIANNHLAYAVQWFLFALTALVIYGLALRKRLRG